MPATDGSCAVVLPNVNVGSVDVDFVTATRSMRGGIIRVEEIGGVAYTLTTLSPENGGGFNISVSTGVDEVKGENWKQEIEILDLQGRKVETPITGFYIIDGRKIIIR